MELNNPQPQTPQSNFVPEVPTSANGPVQARPVAAIVITAVITGLLVGGGVWLATSAQNATLKSKLDAQEQELKTLKAPAVSGKTPLNEVLITPKASVDDTNLTTYQDPYVPSLVFTYSPMVWKLTAFKDRKGDYGTNGVELIDVKNPNNKLVITYSGMSATGAASSTKLYEKKYHAQIGTTWHRLKRRSDVETYFYTVTQVEDPSPAERQKAFARCDEDKLIGTELCKEFLDTNMLFGHPFAKLMNVVQVNVDPTTIVPSYLISTSDTFSLPWGNMAKNKRIVLVIEYTGNRPQEADEIVKQIKLE